MAVTATIGSRTLQRIRLHIDNPAPSATITGVIRTDINGTAAVRVENGKFPNAAVSFDVFDYEYSFIADTTPITYAVYAGTAIVATVTVTPAITQAARLYLTCPLHPSLSLILAGGLTAEQTYVTTHTERRETGTSMHRVVGRPDPIPVLRGLNFASGTMEFSCPSLDAAQDLVAVLAHGEVFMLRHSDPLSLDMYFTVAGTDLTHGDTTRISTTTGRTERRWTVAVQFDRVARPSGNLAPTAGWTYEDLVPYGTYAALQGPFPTYGDLVVGP
jgi:hypothetical protein